MTRIRNAAHPLKAASAENIKISIVRMVQPSAEKGRIIVLTLTNASNAVAVDTIRSADHFRM